MQTEVRKPVDKYDKPATWGGLMSWLFVAPALALLGTLTVELPIFIWGHTTLGHVMEAIWTTLLGAVTLWTWYQVRSIYVAKRQAEFYPHHNDDQS